MDVWVVADPPCAFYKLQRMQIGCRPAWDWNHMYVPQQKNIGQVLNWEPLLSDQFVESWRSLPVRNRRYVPVPATCTDPP